jgi:hypothetical protein
MKKGIGDDPSSSTTDTGKADLIISEGSAQQKRAASELFFVECRRQSMNTGTRDVTLIYLSFTNTDISIALPGCGVTVEGGTIGKMRLQLPGPLGLACGSGPPGHLVVGDTADGCGRPRA